MADAEVDILFNQVDLGTQRASKMRSLEEKQKFVQQPGKVLVRQQQAKRLGNMYTRPLSSLSMSSAIQDENSPPPGQPRRLWTSNFCNVTEHGLTKHAKVCTQTEGPQAQETTDCIIKLKQADASHLPLSLCQIRSLPHDQLVLRMLQEQKLRLAAERKVSVLSKSGKDIKAYQGQRQSFFRNFQTSKKTPEQEKQGQLNGGRLEKQRFFPAVYLASTLTLDTSSFDSTQKSRRFLAPDLKLLERAKAAPQARMTGQGAGEPEHLDELDKDEDFASFLADFEKDIVNLTCQFKQVPA
ncbi:hypothetical protein GUITHDRAFT_142624 [Guillardia theta CCMP2712]|uniref:Uncharacterized protein n=1 Tax=Guillardia theta (strain CCMP2712) TaxID=905079 RepID=L1IW66_GUITC|nr:hypothetical protein GUITHDRAFT_142624 [Guillardia theta CCMP2712]EKX40508.1 hypothetical protein GUITHDRAFT_142624 [Guillardia theta CCMP2712]|eukprot:XP_005827488.1 hypothetical protein GUITHDRAFT_142624 [Guillardia theta CCMP2712]